MAKEEQRTLLEFLLLQIYKRINELKEIEHKILNTKIIYKYKYFFQIN